ncbi:MAG TPA: hypothetical protein VKR05_02020 [Candidatus Cybelea sp.]|nr:hypothetical protein [Candidatus Cybelea sp.]
MVVTWVKKLLSGVALGCAATAVLASAASADPSFSYYDTAITQVYGSQYPLTGKLDLELFPDGTLRGHYHTTYYKLYVPVAGGRDGNYIWFDIGPSSIDLGLGTGPQGKLHVVATMDGDGGFRGQVYPETAAVLSGLAMQYQFTTPSPLSENSNDQYVFAARPSHAEQAPTP